MIIITTQCFAPKIGGIEALMTGMADAMYNAGKDVIVLADGQEEASDKLKKYQVIRFSGWKPIRRRNKAKYLKKYAQSNEVEAIYADSWKSIEYLKGLNNKVVALAHGTEIPKRYFDNLHGFFNIKKRRIISSYNNCNMIAANSSYTKDLMIASLNVNAKKIKIIHPGIDIYKDFIQEEDRNNVSSIIGNSSPVLTTLARIEKRKGHKFVINAVAKLKSKFPNIVYLIAGKGPYLKEIKTYVEKMDLKDYVLFLGWITEPEKSLLLKNSDLFIMTPTKVGESVEGFGMVFIDAAFHGVASIGTSSGGIADAILHNKTGIICEEGNQNNITNNIKILLENEEYRKELGYNGMARARKEYSWDTKILEYLNI